MNIRMTPEEFYNAVYKIIGNATPLDGVDCGRLCNGACCAVTEEVSGMYLFPKEDEMYKVMPPWGEIYETDFTYNKKSADLFTCNGSCLREMRPLSCRIFPLVPSVHRNGKMEIKMDIRGRGMCPLSAAMHIEDLSLNFVKRVTAAMRFCMCNEEVREFLYALTASLDEMEESL